jgi:hypothetical protein
MNTLFDRYFLVLAGRLTPDHWGSVATPVHAGSGVITLGWPPEEQQTSATQERARSAELTPSRSLS